MFVIKTYRDDAGVTHLAETLGTHNGRELFYLCCEGTKGRTVKERWASAHAGPATCLWCLAGLRKT